MKRGLLNEIFVGSAFSRISYLRIFVCLFFLIFIFSIAVFPQIQYDNRLISSVVISFEGAERDVSATAQFELIAKNALGERYSAVKVRNALAALYRTDRIASARVEAENVGTNNIILRFVIRRKTQA